MSTSDTSILNFVVTDMRIFTKFQKIRDQLNQIYRGHCDAKYCEDNLFSAFLFMTIRIMILLTLDKT